MTDKQAVFLLTWLILAVFAFDEKLREALHLTCDDEDVQKTLDELTELQSGPAVEVLHQVVLAAQLDALKRCRNWEERNIMMEQLEAALTDVTKKV